MFKTDQTRSKNNTVKKWKSTAKQRCLQGYIRVFVQQEQADAFAAAQEVFGPNWLAERI